LARTLRRIRAVSDGAHPHLAAAFADPYPNESPDERLGRILNLVLDGCSPSRDARQDAGHHSDQCSGAALPRLHRSASCHQPASVVAAASNRAARLSNVVATLARGAGGPPAAHLRWRAGLDGEPGVKSR
jgi:hypothetical protein